MKHWSYEIGEYVVINEKYPTDLSYDVGRLACIKDLLATNTYDYRLYTNNGEINVREHEINKVDKSKLSRYLNINNWKKVRIKDTDDRVYDVVNINYLTEKVCVKLDNGHCYFVEFNKLQDAESEEEIMNNVGTTQGNKDLHKKLLDEIHDTYVRKNTDYGNSFEEQYKEYGLLSALIRFDDKIRRLKQLNKHEAQVKDESIRDSALDLANYAIMTVMELDKLKG